MDFIDFMESFENEKPLLKSKINDLAKFNKIQLVCVDNPEEVLFILTNLYLTTQQGMVQNG